MRVGPSGDCATGPTSHGFSQSTVDDDIAATRPLPALTLALIESAQRETCDVFFVRCAQLGPGISALTHLDSLRATVGLTPGWQRLLIPSVLEMSYSTPLPIELIDEIISCVGETTTDVRFDIEVLTDASRRNLLSCALSCSTFFRPAMRNLWRTSELLWLLRLLPALEVVDGSYVITDQLDNVSLKRFDVYSAMVKRLVLPGPSTNTPPPVHKSVYTSLALIRPRPLPSLTHVYCSAHTSLSNETFLIISPLLESVVLSYCGSQDTMAYLTRIREEAPFMHSLTIGQTLGEFDFAYVSQLRNLQVFDLYLFLTAIETQPLQYPRSLKQLHLRGALYAAKDVFTVLRMYRDSGVESFSLQGALSGEDFRTIFSTVSSQWPLTMTTLSLQLNIVELVREKEGLLDVIRPLFSLGNIQNFTGSFYCPGGDIYITDAFIGDICQAWPRLVKLELSARRHEYFPTVASLTLLSEACPKLEILTIPFDTLHIPSMQCDEHRDALLSSKSSHKLESITLLGKYDFQDEVAAADEDEVNVNVLNEVIANASTTSLAYHLDIAFPYLKEARIFNSDGTGKEQERKVMDVIGVCQGARREEGISL
ncbi:hypothetical protein D9758_009477 [Tetrapyrgos nigripes]|uniref:Uncharacterized protein n=1 Tax=Tetrapyrgos nigripes TaxID=182062 RepID=A0A8H5G127_9AGAR|nr:hypothetical protein D9758_009477 [Tetrapyrgos nigripes]